MTIKQFIEKAWEGGYKPSTELQNVDRAFVHLKFKSDICEQPVTSWMIERVLLDPEAWRAVGKVEGWEKGKRYRQSVPARKGPRGQSYPAVIRMRRTVPRPNEWKKKMHGIIDALADGKTIEQYLETL